MERNGQTEATPTVERKTVGHTTPGTGTGPKQMRVVKGKRKKKKLENEYSQLPIHRGEKCPGQW
jgi:hypothetical protein